MKETCPRCRAEAGIPILYGYPTGEMIEAFEQHHAEIGGCVVTGDHPAWHCTNCHFRWGKATRESRVGAAFVSFPNDDHPDLFSESQPPPE